MKTNPAKNILPLILLHIPDRKKQKQIAELCERLSIRTRLLTAQDAARTVGSFAGLAPVTAAAKKQPAGYVLPELIVFCGLSDAVMDVFLKEYKSAGINPVGLKAKVTMYNAGWSIFELVEELKKERMTILLGRG